MNKDVRSGLAILCIAGIMGVLWFAIGRTSDPAAQSGAGMLGLVAALSAIAGFGVLIKGVLTD